MISIIINHFLNIFLSVGMGCFILFIAGVFYLFTKPAPPVQPTKVNPVIEPPVIPKQTSITISLKDITAIAGDDIIATQLDLARAYIESGRKRLAKKILEFVILKGNTSQQQEARNLLGLI